MNIIIEAIKELATSGIEKLFIEFFLFLSAFKWALETFDSVRKTLNGAHLKKSQSDSQAAMLKKHSQEIDDIKKHFEYTEKQIALIKGLIESNTAKADRQVTATLRETLWRMHKEFTSRSDPYITENELKIFNDLGTVYEEAGGNDIYHDKLRPDIMKLPVKYE